MPRELSPPSFPDTPAAWLSRYRHRFRDADGFPLPPERLGELIGVSGATVRRWESGSSLPSESDLRHFAVVCDLSQLETEFILAAFQPRETETPSDRGVFESVIAGVLRSEHPAFVLDSLFYRRAWNSHINAISRRSAAPRASNTLATVLGSFYSSGTDEEKEEFTSRWLRDFWLYTAHLCGTEPYRDLLNLLATSPEFKRKWSILGLQKEGPLTSIGVPYYYSHPHLGTYRIFTLRIMLPPVYYLKEYVPVDETARRHIDKTRAARPLRVIFDEVHHWGLEEPHAATKPRITTGETRLSHPTFATTAAPTRVPVVRTHVRHSTH